MARAGKAGGGNGGAGNPQAGREGGVQAGGGDLKGERGLVFLNPHSHSLDSLCLPRSPTGHETRSTFVFHQPTVVSGAFTVFPFLSLN